MKNVLVIQFPSIIIGMLLLAACTSGSCSTTIIDILYDNTIGNFTSHPYNVDTFGQTFTAPINTNTMLNFSFWTQGGYNSTEPVSFRGYVMEWDGTRATGPILYQSDIKTSTREWGEGIERFDFNAGEISIIPGNSYVAFLSCVGTYTIPPNHNAWLYLMMDYYDPHYDDGMLVYSTSYADFSNLTTAEWNVQQGAYDLGFHATFTMIPEPSSIFSLLCGISGMGGVVWRKRSM